MCTVISCFGTKQDLLVLVIFFEKRYQVRFPKIHIFHLTSYPISLHLFAFLSLLFFNLILYVLPFSTSCTSPSFKSKTSSAVLGPLYFVPSNNTLSANFGNWIIASRGLDTPSIRKHKLSLSLSLAFDLLYYSFKSFFPIFLNYITMFIYLCYSFYLLFHLSILLYLPIYVTLSNSLYYCICLSSSDNVTVPSVILSMDLCYSVLRSLFIYSSL